MSGPEAVLTAAFTSTVNLDVTSGASILDLKGSSGNDTFALGASLGTEDRIDGGAGTDTVSAMLPITAAGVTLRLAPTLTGVEALNLTSPSAAGASVRGLYAVSAGDIDAGTVSISGGRQSDSFRFDVQDARGTWDASAYGGFFSITAALHADGVTFVGGSFQDDITGSAGDDTVDLREGVNSFATGGAGADTFRFSVAPSNATLATIRDFTSGLDRLLLDNDVMAALGSPGAFDPGQFVILSSSPTSTEAGVLKYYEAFGLLYYDGNGTAVGGLTQIATIQNAGAATPLAASDISVY
jgi:hypothetical protein